MNKILFFVYLFIPVICIFVAFFVLLGYSSLLKRIF